MRGVIAFIVGFYSACVVAAPQSRIVGGSTAVINSYPYVAAVLRSSDNVTFSQVCVGSIINTRSILTAASCIFKDNSSYWRIRVGSSFANTGGKVHNVQSIILHPYFNPGSLDSDIAILRSTKKFEFNNTVQAGVIAGSSYMLNDNQPVWAVGWGSTYYGGPPSDLLRHVQIWTVNQQICASRYKALGYAVTNNMLCSGWLDVGGRDQCQNDVGGPLIHNNVIVGIASWGYGCGLPTYPGVNTRVSRFTSWIQANA
ncbi:trypsin CFT-1-like isoform X1 [Colias croceus]|uniref:trypsin CFT-1-like isoform X1 n=1 Tax=Colias crocea TaxID=72248 RepID=UPI001E27B647|nr:trypsin CFT-1-like isoform X1 [Colias croceus]